MKFTLFIFIIFSVLFYSCEDPQIDVILSEDIDRTPNDGPKRFLALGDLYTMGFKVDSLEKWPKQFVDSLRIRGLKINEPEIIAGRLWKAKDLEQGIKQYGTARGYDLIALMIGVNDEWLDTPFDEFRESYRNVLTLALQKTLDDPSKIIILSIPDYGYTPWNFGRKEKISPHIEKLNDIIKELAEDYNIEYIDIVPLTRLAYLFADHTLAEDGFHYTGVHYATWVEYLLKNYNFFNVSGD